MLRKSVNDIPSELTSGKTMKIAKLAMNGREKRRR